MSERENSRLAVVENEISHIKETTTRIENLLMAHVTWEEKKYKEMESKFATKSSQLRIESEMQNLPKQIEETRAGKWVEKVALATIVSVPAILVSLAAIYFSYIK